MEHSKEGKLSEYGALEAPPESIAVPSLGKLRPAILTLFKEAKAELATAKSACRR